MATLEHTTAITMMNPLAPTTEKDPILIPWMSVYNTVVQRSTPANGNRIAKFTVPITRMRGSDPTRPGISRSYAGFSTESGRSGTTTSATSIATRPSAPAVPKAT